MWFKKRCRSIRFEGDYRTWEEALKDSSGYDSELILKKTCEALLKVKNGQALYERDSVLFDEVQHSFPLLAGLLRAAVENAGDLSILDFGGSLGSSYFQCRSFLSVVRKIEWLVIEQPEHVRCGRKYFEDGILKFYESIGECMSKHRPTLALLSSVLQYLPGPYETLDQLLALRIRYFIIDRTGFLLSERDRLTVQFVPENIYEASYPAWFLNERKLVSQISRAGYVLLADFEALDEHSPAGEEARYKGFIFRLKS
jgi:putative methyltransferase (TIGR04325 family)